jgi:transcriptional regulator GlxA family with amidase domain
MRGANLEYENVWRAVREYVEGERNYRNPKLTAAMVAEAVGVSRTSLTKVLKEVRQVTFLQYLDNVRIRRAHHALTMCKGVPDMEHIAFLCGFGSVRTFKEKYNKTYGI